MRSPQDEDAALEALRSRAAEFRPGRIEPYGPHPDQVLEWYAPETAGAAPLVLVHGGFFRPTIDRTHARPLAAALADELGRPVVLVEYRREPGHPEASVADINAVSDLLEGLGEEPVAWIGHSAGGTLVLQRALDQIRPGIPALALAPVADLTSAMTEELGNGAVREWIGSRTAAKPSRYASLDPVRLLAALPERRTLIRCVHGEEDLTVPISQSRDSGLPVLRLAGAHHYDLIDPDSAFFTAVIATVAEMTEAGPADR